MAELLLLTMDEAKQYLRIDDDDEEVRVCPECNAGLYWDGDEWVCSNCDYTEED